MPFNTIQPSFAAGELSPALHARIDLSKYAVGAKHLTNFFVHAHGGASNRAGTEFVFEALGETRLIPFQYNVEQTYMLAFSSWEMMILKDGEVVTTALCHTGYFNWTASGSGTNEYYLVDTHGIVAAKPDTVWENDSEMTYGTLGSLAAGGWGWGDNDALGADTLYVRLSDGTDPDTKYATDPYYVEIVTVVATPFTTDQSKELKYAQSADTLFLTHPDRAPRELTRYGHFWWEFSSTTFTASATTPDNPLAAYTGGAAYAIEYKISAVSASGGESAPTDAVSVMAAVSTNWAAGTYVRVAWNSLVNAAYKWTASGTGTGEFYLELAAGGDPGLDTPAAVYEDGELMTAKASAGALAVGEWAMDDNDTLGFTTLYVRIAGGADPDGAGDHYITYDIDDDVDYYRIYKNSRGAWGYIGDTEGRVFDDDNIAPDTSDGPQEEFAGFSAIGEYPGAVGIYAQRLMYGRSDDYPQTTWMSQSGRLRNFGTSRPLKDDDSIEVTLASRQVNEIRHLVPLDKLLVFTSGGEWLLSSGDAGGLTPTSLKYTPQSYYGSSDLAEPIVIGSTALFVQRGGRIVRDFSYQLQNDAYTGSDLTVLAGHLFAGKEIVSWAFQANPDSIVWVVMDDGSLLAFTYLREHEVWAWTPMETDGLVEDVGTILGDTEDEVYFIVKRTVGGSDVRFIEKLHSRTFDLAEDAFFVDCGLTYDGWNTTADDYLKITEIGGAGYDGGDSVTLTATGHTPFSAGSVGDTYFLQDEDVESATYGERISVIITAYTSTSVVTAELQGDAPSGLEDTNTSTWAKGVTTISGLDHLEGETLSILADGNVCAQDVVASGAIEIAQPAAKIHAGLPYTALLETLNVDFSTADGTVQGRKKAINKVVLRLKDTRAAWVGPDTDNLTEIPMRTGEGYNEAIDLFTGDKEHLLTAIYGTGGNVVVQQADPLPITVLAIIPQTTLGAL